MECYQGKAIEKGIAIGRILFHFKGKRQIKKESIEDCVSEVRRYEAARELASAELFKLHQKAVEEIGEAGAAVFEAYAMILRDDVYNDFVVNIIRTQKVNAEYAVSATSDNFYKLFSEMDDDYFRARAADVRDVSERLLSALEGKPCESDPGGGPVIVAAKALSPSETVQMDQTKLLAFVTEQGADNSHMAILARTMELPALSGIPVNREWDGRQAVVDGYSGTLYLDPDETLLSRMQARMEEDKKRAALLKELKGKETVTRDGRKIRLCANIGSTSDVAAVLENDAEGIGLFRSEFLYLEKTRYPGEEELFQTYKTVAEQMEGKQVIIRTLDIGADKRAGYFGLKKEENPAMGLRAIRLCLSRPEMFKTQLRAIFRASAFGNLAVMYPMIISVDEIRRVKAIVREVKEELKAGRIAYRDMEQGVMIETPAAAVISDLLAEEVDFFSIGTNDLTQYTLAIDRQNVSLDEFYDAHHPAVLRLIEQTVKNGHAGGCWVGICGELGADTSLIEEFLRMGIDELSVSPSRVLPVRKEIRAI